jgi:hypothetical protein
MSSITDYKGGNIWSSIRAIWNRINGIENQISNITVPIIVSGSFTNTSLIDGILLIAVPTATNFNISLIDNTGTKQMVDGISRLYSSTVVRLDLGGYYPITGTWKYTINIY